VGQAPPPLPQVQAQQATPQTSQVGVPFADFMQYEKFLMDQTAAFGNFTKEQFNFLKQEHVNNLEFIKNES
jgi:hypothetical protein